MWNSNLTGCSCLIICSYLGLVTLIYENQPRVKKILGLKMEILRYKLPLELPTGKCIWNIKISIKQSLKDKYYMISLSGGM